MTSFDDFYISVPRERLKRSRSNRDRLPPVSSRRVWVSRNRVPAVLISQYVYTSSYGMISNNFGPCHFFLVSNNALPRSSFNSHSSQRAQKMLRYSCREIARNSSSSLSLSFLSTGSGTVYLCTFNFFKINARCA